MFCRIFEKLVCFRASCVRLVGNSTWNEPKTTPPITTTTTRKYRRKHKSHFHNMLNNFVMISPMTDANEDNNNNALSQWFCQLSCEHSLVLLFRSALTFDEQQQQQQQQKAICTHSARTCVYFWQRCAVPHKRTAHSCSGQHHKNLIGFCQLLSNYNNNNNNNNNKNQN